MTGFWNGQAQLYNLSNSAELPTTWAPIAAGLVKDLNQTERIMKIGTWNWTDISKTSFRLSEPEDTTDPEVQPIHVSASTVRYMDLTNQSLPQLGSFGLGE